MKTQISLCTNVAIVVALTFSAFFALASEKPAAEQDVNESVKDIYVSDNTLERIAVEWVEPASFTDVRDTNSSREKFRKHVFSQLEKHLEKLAKDLPAGQMLKLSVTDVDLAGRVEPAFFVGLSNSMNDIRVMRDIDIPRLKFTYTLNDANGNVLKSDDVNLKNMNYLRSAGMTSRNRPFAYEKIMISKWFAQHIKDANA